MKKLVGVTAGLAITAVMSTVTFTAANALWSAHASTQTPAMEIGNVQFAAYPEQNVDAKHVSTNGESISVTLPGSKIIEVLQQDAVGAEPVIWRFTTEGRASGIAGLDYTVSLKEQTGSKGIHPLDDGVALKGTVLAGSTAQVYPAAAGGDCSTVPEVPSEGEGPKRNVYLYDNEDAQLQAPGASAEDGSAATEEWCVALNWNQELDGMYVNSVWATGLAEDGSQMNSYDRWNAAVGFPPSLDLMGTYRNIGQAEGQAEDATKARTTDEWFADVYPDPSGEPDVVISIDPIVTNLNPDVEPRD